MKRTLIFAGMAVLATVALALSGQPLKLRPGTIGNGAVAKWETNRAPGAAANHVLVLWKQVPTTEYEAAGADIQGLRGTPVVDIDALSWTDLTPTPTLGDGSPRWVLYYGQPGGEISGYTFLEPSVSDTNTDGKIDQAEIQANPYFVGSAPTVGDEVKYLQIIVDVQERVVLDDIMVRVMGQTTTFSGPGNSN
jgi:hypothetical protein